MTAPSFPPPDATAAEVATWHEAQRTAQKGRRTTHAPRLGGMCSSCGLSGHRRGDAACPNYETPARWLGNRAVSKERP